MIVILFLTIALAVRMSLPKPVKSLDTAFDLSQIVDGIYFGYCDNGLVTAEVKVTIQNKTIAKVDLFGHQNGPGSDAETIVDAVIEHQSVEVDAI